MQTKENLMKMFEMHLDGVSHAEIGRQFGLSRERVRQIVGNSSLLLGRPITRRAFPGIARWMFEHGVSVKRMAEDLKMTMATLGTKLRGDRAFIMPEIKAILAYTGLTFEEAFGKED